MSQISDSFVSLVTKHTLPIKYTQFAIDYIPKEIPILKSLNTCDLPTSNSTHPVPFKEAILDRNIKHEENAAEIKQSSLKKRYIISSSKKSQIIQQQLEKAQSSKSMFFKGKKICEINKALVIDSKFPKVDEDSVREKFSSVHILAMENSRRTLREKSTPKEVRSCLKLMESDGKSFKRVEEIVHEILGQPEPLPQLQNLPQPWQYKSNLTGPKREKILSAPKKVLPFKKNVYPQKTYEERVKGRKVQVAKALKQSTHKDVDTLSGIWEPGLMVNDFQVTGLNYDSRVHEFDQEVIREPLVNWYDLQNAIGKVQGWLEKWNEHI